MTRYVGSIEKITFTFSMQKSKQKIITTEDVFLPRSQYLFSQRSVNYWPLESRILFLIDNHTNTNPRKLRLTLLGLTTYDEIDISGSFAFSRKNLSSFTTDFRAKVHFMGFYWFLESLRKSGVQVLDTQISIEITSRFSSEGSLIFFPISLFLFFLNRQFGPNCHTLYSSYWNHSGIWRFGACFSSVDSVHYQFHHHYCFLMLLNDFLKYFSSSGLLDSHLKFPE